MNKIKSILDFLNTRVLSSTYQIRRLIVLMIVIIGLLVLSFGTYYYYDRYYDPQQSVAQTAISQAEQAVSADPQNIDKRLHLAETYIVYQHFDQAVNQAEQVEQTDPTNVEADFVLGLAYANDNKPQQAVAPFQKFINARQAEANAALDQELQSAYYYLGDSYLKLGQPQSAIAPLETTVKEVGTDSDSLYKLGMAYGGVKRYGDAINAFQAATEFVPNYTEAYQGMADAYTALNQPDLAGYGLGMVAYSKKDYRSALSLLLPVAQARPDFAPAFVGLGQVYEATNDLKDAQTSYQTALKIDPNNFAATNGLQRVNLLLGK
ncbi:MAG TPA: tetratricopeptide repeat protein [Anaerolineales bacterium]|nr:tetratricopeptide repeat protein [Anaerolineales bacterium]